MKLILMTDQLRFYVEYSFSSLEWGVVGLSVAGKNYHDLKIA